MAKQAYCEALSCLSMECMDVC